MNSTFSALLDSLRTTPEEAVKTVRSGDTVYIGTCTSVAYCLCDSLLQRAGELERVRLTCAMVLQPTERMKAMQTGPFSIETYFLGPYERAMQKRGLVDYTSIHLSEVDRFCTETAPADVAFFEVSPPDENGYMSYGASGVGLHTYIKAKARTVIVQINPCVPYVLGKDNRIHLSEVDAVVEETRPVPVQPSLQYDRVIQSISQYLLDQIPDGACIQLGMGGVASAVGFGLKTKNDLGAHTEMMSDSLMNLMKLGVLNNSRKQFLRGRTVTAFTLGSEELYRFIDHNEDMYYMPFPYVNDPRVISQNDNVISVNTALSADLFGQVSADHIAGRQYSATGGQLDFVRGAQMSRGGKSFIAMSSTVQKRDGSRTSRIVPQFPAGTVVTTPRSDVQYVVTEYGCVNLRKLTMKDRVRAMIGLAHPDFRPQLTDDAAAAGLL